MPDLLVRDIDDDLKRLIEDRARSHRRSLSDEVKALLRERLVQTHDGRKLGSEMFNLVRPEDRGDDLVFEIPGEVSPPPDLE
jgi:plasmid stability protein